MCLLAGWLTFVLESICGSNLSRAPSLSSTRDIYERVG